MMWKKDPKPEEIKRRFRSLCTEFFQDERGQEFLYFYKLMVRYDFNPYTIAQGDRAKADSFEGMKDAIRIIETAMQEYNQEKECRDQNQQNSKTDSFTQVE